MELTFSWHLASVDLSSLVFQQLNINCCFYIAQIKIATGKKRLPLNSRLVSSGILLLSLFVMALRCIFQVSRATLRAYVTMESQIIDNCMIHGWQYSTILMHSVLVCMKCSAYPRIQASSLPSKISNFRLVSWRSYEQENHSSSQRPSTTAEDFTSRMSPWISLPFR